MVETRPIVRNRALWIAVATTASYWILAAILPQIFLYELVTYILFGVAVAVAASWAPAAGRAFLYGGGEGSWQAIIGVNMLAWSVVADRIWVLGWLWQGYGYISLDHPMTAFTKFGMIVSFILFLTSPGTTLGDVPPRNWFWVAAGVLAGGCIASFMIGVAVAN